jgi:hypothetical protein
LGGTTQPLARLRELLKEAASAAITLGRHRAGSCIS